MARQTAAKRQTAIQKRMALVSDCTALYIRVSTDRQASEGFSLDAQQKQLDAYCVAKGWTVCADHVFVDAGESGTSTDRPRFQAMLQAAKDGAIKRIVAVKLDRVARNVRDFLALVDELKTWGCDLVLLKENFDTGTASGKFALTMFAALAELEAATITERVMTGKHQKASEGGYNGSAAPLGYSYANGAFTPNDDADTVRSIFAWFNAGESMLGIVRKLEAMGAKTAKGGKWNTATVRYILRNGLYAGIAQWDSVESEGARTAIIDVATYEQAQQRLANLKPGNPNFGHRRGLRERTLLPDKASRLR